MKKNNKAYAAYNIDESVRKESSSGGVFSAVATHLFNNHNNTYVFGAAFDENFNVNHICVDNEKDLFKLRGSKYVQSNIGESPKQVKELLEKGNTVLFSGTPCQVSGLYNYLKKDYDNLYTIDIVCHGTCVKKVFNKYVEYLKETYKSDIASISFRNKEIGWNNFSTEIIFCNGCRYLKHHDEDLYMKLFLKNLILNNGCYDCKFKGDNHVADITLGDLWGIENFDDIKDDDKGMSLLLTNTQKGNDLVKELQNSIYIQEIDKDLALRYNSAYSKSPYKPGSRELLLKDLDRINFDKLVEFYCSDDKKIARRRQLREDYEVVKKEKGAVFAILWSIKNRFLS